VPTSDLNPKPRPAKSPTSLNPPPLPLDFTLHLQQLPCPESLKGLVFPIIVVVS
jgi:hypothetical protein